MQQVVACTWAAVVDVGSDWSWQRRPSLLGRSVKPALGDFCGHKVDGFALTVDDGYSRRASRKEKKNKREGG
jgi:hypothetical protein